MTLTTNSDVGQTIGFCRLLPRAFGPQNFMKNCGLYVGRVANLRPIANRPSDGELSASDILNNIRGTGRLAIGRTPESRPPSVHSESGADLLDRAGLPRPAGADREVGCGPEGPPYPPGRNFHPYSCA